MTYLSTKYLPLKGYLEEHARQFFQAEDFEIHHIRRCIDKHAACNHFSYSNYLLYRVSQIFFHIIGQSDWQKACRQAVDLMKSKYLSQVDFSQIQNKHALPFIADKILSAFVLVYAFHARHFGQEDLNKVDKVMEGLKKITIEYYLEFQIGSSDCSPIFFVHQEEAES